MGIDDSGSLRRIGQEAAFDQDLAAPSIEPAVMLEVRPECLQFF